MTLLYIQLHVHFHFAKSSQSGLYLFIQQGGCYIHRMSLLSSLQCTCTGLNTALHKHSQEMNSALFLARVLIFSVPTEDQCEQSNLRHCSARQRLNTFHWVHTTSTGPSRRHCLQNENYETSGDKLLVEYAGREDSTG